MKGKHVVLFVLLLAAAGVIGWFLPVLAAAQKDQDLEGKAETISVRQIDLSYQFDLSIEDKLLLIRDGLVDVESVQLERGILLTDRDARAVTERFLRDLTGNAVQLTEDNCAAQPELLRFEEDGSFLVWNLTAEMDETWYFEATLDDQTGMILRCVIACSSSDFGTLFRGFAEAVDIWEFISSSAANALAACCNRQLYDGWSVRVENMDLAFSNGSFQLLLTGEGGDSMTVPFLLELSGGYLALNP
jgi:hypothetical protein